MQAFSKVWDPFLNLITLRQMIALETVIHSPRKLGAALGTVHTKLMKMEQKGVIAKVEEPTQ